MVMLCIGFQLSFSSTALKIASLPFTWERFESLLCNIDNEGPESFSLGPLSSCLFQVSCLAIVYPVVFAWPQSVAFCTDLAESFLLGTIAKLNEGAYIMEVNMISVCCVSSSVQLCTVQLHFVLPVILGFYYLLLNQTSDQLRIISNCRLAVCICSDS